MSSEVRALIQQATHELSEAECVSPQNDAELLLAFVLGIERSELVSVQSVSADQATQYFELVSKRALRIPLQHLTGTAYFRYLSLKVGPGVFIPRPETELLVQAGLAELAKVTGPKLAVDLCAGSGAVAMSLALESPNTTVHAVELSTEAFSWFEKNLHSYSEQFARLNSSVIPYNDDATSRELLDQLSGSADVVLSNPPYIPDAMIPREPEVRDYDPALALYGGQDGLVVARKVSLVAADLLKPNGFFAMEHADVQSESVVQMLLDLKNDGQQLWKNIEDNLDYNQLPRFVTAYRTQTTSSGAI